MPDFKITPWMGPYEVIRLRGMFYPEKHDTEQGLKRHACETVSAWQKRGGVPHAIVATSALTDAGLNDNPKYASVQSISAVYSTAYSQFVTGLTDVEQTSKAKKSMFEVGRDIAMPPAFIELRHQITHEGQVSLVELRRSAKEAIDWLYEYYWKQLTGNEQKTNSSFEHGQKVVPRAELKPILRSFNNKQVEAAKTYSALAKKGQLTTDLCIHGIKPMVRQVVNLCMNEPKNIKVLVGVLLDEELLVPPSKVIGSPVDEVMTIWDKALRELSHSQTKFLVMLTDELSYRLVAPISFDITKDGKREALFQWLKHIYTDAYWQKTLDRWGSPAEVQLKVCIASPGHWTLRLAFAIMNDKRYQALKERYSHEVSRVMQKNDVPDTHTHEMAARTLELLDQSESALAKGKSPWIPKPIGLAEGSREVDDMILE